MERFIDRESEMQTLTQEYQRKGSSLVMLYGRRTAQIRLKQIPFRHYHEFFPGKIRRELIEMYSVTGDVPKYIELFSESGDVYSSIQACVLNRSGYLYDEPHFLLQQEVSEIGSYFSVIKAIAAGNSKLSAISTVLKNKSTSLTKYLKTLIDLDILEREVTVTEENPERSKKDLTKSRTTTFDLWYVLFSAAGFTEEPKAIASTRHDLLLFDELNI